MGVSYKLLFILAPSGKKLKESTIMEVLKSVWQLYLWLFQRDYSVEFDSEALRGIYRAKRKE